MFVKYSKELDFAFSYKGLTSLKKIKDIQKRKDFIFIQFMGENRLKKKKPERGQWPKIGRAHV